MQLTGEDGSRIISANNQHRVYSITFADAGKQVLSGGVEGLLRRWQADDGHEIGTPIQVKGAKIYAVAVSPDRKWLVCGLKFPDGGNGEARVGVWDAQTHEKVLNVHGHTDSVFSVHISFDSTKFATGGSDKLAFIWNMTTGERLVGPLQHDGWVVAVQFSPTGDRIATTTAENLDAKSIRIYKSDNGQQLLNIPFPAKAIISSSLTWSADGLQLFAVSYGEAKCFDSSSGSLRSKWSIPGKGHPASIALARNEKFIITSSHNSLSFWDASTHQQIGTVLKHANPVWSIALSSNDDCIATGEENGKITFRNLRDVLPASYFTVTVSDEFSHVVEPDRLPFPFSPSYLSQLPLIHITDAILKLWMQGDLARVGELLTEEIEHSPHPHPLYHARALAHRAFVRIRLKQWNMAIEDAKKSIEARRSVIGYIAGALAHVSNGDHESAMCRFDIVFTDGLATENNLLLLIKAIILFKCGKHEHAISRLGVLIDIVDDRSVYNTVQAQMLFILGDTSLREGHNKRAMELLRRARDAINPFQTGPYLVVISLIFGWDFDRLDGAIQLRLQECIKLLESHDDAAGPLENPKEAIVQYSDALSLNLSNPAGLLVNRSKAWAVLGQWEDALKDADEAIKVDPLSPWGYKGRHAALHGLQRYDEAIDAFSCMLSLIEESPDPDARKLRKKYVSTSQSETIIENIARGIHKISPLVLIDVKSGRLCDGQKRMDTFKSEVQFKEILSSMTEALDDERVQRGVEEYFLYVTFSHVWQGKEPSFQDVNLANSVWELDSSPLNEKLRKFCEVVRSEGYRWAWSDTCCIDKTISTVLNQSLTMMYKWYTASATTFVLLADVESPSALGNLTDSGWMTRAWTAQELLAGKVIRFYTRDWKPYVGDTRSNHKESPEILQELADAIGVARETIITFNPDDLSIRAKLRLASTRNATVEEDVAYSLIGIFKSDIIPRYGEGDAALGHLLEEIVARSGDVTVLAWTGMSSPYNSCLPATLAVYSQAPCTSPAIEGAEMEVRAAALRTSLPEEEATLFHTQVTRLPPARFAHRRLYLPCIIFAVKRLGVQDFGHGHEYRYRARVSGIGDVEFQTSERLSPTEPRKLIFVHPWIRDLRDPFDGFSWGSTADDDEYESDPEPEIGSVPTSPLHVLPAATLDDYTRALRLIVRLQQPFHMLLLQQQPHGEFKRIAAEREIIVPGIEHRINFARDVRTEVVEIL